ncbi:DNA cytosine methyltransferase [Burkholderia ubonensis]|uniref:DNA cytosine methyltransferase n=1 Tax=Burkholderia ubonensis TaxID=101571 RepID=UPI0009B49874|nr:DNA cytosine methyltransferase [Burkholderia ubonensis]
MVNSRVELVVVSGSYGWGIRKLSPEECARLQGFEQGGFRFPDDMSRTQRYRQIGNAVTVPLVRLLARECRRILK